MSGCTFLVQVQQKRLFHVVSSEYVFGRAHPVKTDGCEKFLWLMIYNSFTSPALVVIALYGRDPLNSRYMYHFFSDRKEKKWLYWTMMMVEYVNEMLILHPWLFIFFLLWVYTKSTAFWLQQMRYCNEIPLKSYGRNSIENSLLVDLEPIGGWESDPKTSSRFSSN